MMARLPLSAGCSLAIQEDWKEKSLLTYFMRNAPWPWSRPPSDTREFQVSGYTLAWSLDADREVMPRACGLL